MKTTPIMHTLKTELSSAFDASGLTNAEFARRAEVSPAMALRLRDPFENSNVDTVARALRVLGKRLDIRVVDMLTAGLIALMTLIPLAAIAQAPAVPQPCAVIAHAVIHTYTGPIEIEQLCMRVTQHASIPNAPGQTLRFEATDMGDGIFKDGFDEVFQP